VPLDTPLASGQRVEIVTAKSGGPSRDWLNAERGFVKSPRARQKIRQWFKRAGDPGERRAGRAQVEKELRRSHALNANLEQLAAKLGFKQPDELFAAGRARRSESAPASNGVARHRRVNQKIQNQTARKTSSKNRRPGGGEWTSLLTAASALLQAGAARTRCAAS
jgi:(p)ppGpp synthase/HD superfamily hydrolase